MKGRTGNYNYIYIYIYIYAEWSWHWACWPSGVGIEHVDIIITIKKITYLWQGKSEDCKQTKHNTRVDTSTLVTITHGLTTSIDDDAKSSLHRARQSAGLLSSSAKFGGTDSCTHLNTSTASLKTILCLQRWQWRDMLTKIFTHAQLLVASIQKPGQ